MIPKEQLRIGNLVQLHDYKKHATITELREFRCRLTYVREDTGEPHTSLVEYDSINPIPLTEDFLKRFGFEPTMEYKEQLQLGNVTFERYDDTQAKIWWRGRHLGICQRLEFVHQLQNLYYALTGEELTIKP